MRRYVVRKLLTALLIIPGIVTILFLVFGLLGDPSRMLAGQRADVATLESIKTELGLDKPAYIQFLLYLNDLSPVGWLSSNQKASGNYSFIGIGGRARSSVVLKAPYLRRSYQTGRPVAAMYLERLPATLLLTFLSLMLAGLLGTWLGVVAANALNRFPDRLLSLIAVIGVSAPSFFVGVVFVAVFAIWLYPLTGLNMTGYVLEKDVLTDGYRFYLANLILPVLTLGIRPLAIIFQLTRSGMLDALRSDYVRTAHAKGLSKGWITWKHAFPNALNPVVTSLSGSVASLLAGAFFVEYIFDWPGIGKLTVEALYSSDYPVVLGTCLMTGLLFLLINLLMDLLYPLLDPRIKLA